MHDRGKTLVERHALNRLEKVEKNKRKAYEKRSGHFPWKTLIMGSCFFIILILFLIQFIYR